MGLLAWGCCYACTTDGLGNLDVYIVGVGDPLAGDIMLMLIVVFVVFVFVLLCAWLGIGIGGGGGRI